MDYMSEFLKNEYESYVRRVTLLAEAMYDLDENVVEAFEEVIKECHDKDFTPRKTVEIIAAAIKGNLI